jgi:hypothetical protein
VVFGQDVNGAVPVASGVEPSGRFLDEEDKHAVDDGGDELEIEASAPRVLGGEETQGDSDTGGENLSD